MAYATKTKVDVDQTRYEIEKLLKRYGADQFTYASDDELGAVVIRFHAHKRYIQFGIKLPNAGDKECRGKTQQSTRNKVTQATRSKWRALLLSIHGKLESVESKIESFEEAFLAHVVLPDGKTAGEWLRPQVALSYESGRMPTNLLALPAPSVGETT